MMDQTLFTALNAYCSAHPWLLHLASALGVGGAAPILFLAGLAGGFSHCAGMCGPFVLAQIAGGPQLSRAPLGEGPRLVRAVLAPYHLGRFTTYVALGAALGGISGFSARLSGAHWLLGAFLGIAALVFLAQGLTALTGIAGLGGANGAGLVAGPLVRLARPLLADPAGWRGYALGVALGFLPCGLLWGALVAAAGAGGTLAGATGMAAFTLGTAPALVAVGYVGVFFGRRAPRTARRITIPLTLSNAAFLGFLALRAFA